MLAASAAAAGGTASASPVPAWVAASTRRLTWAGCSTASAWAIMPPIDHPSTAVRPNPRAAIRALVWSAMVVTVSGSTMPVAPTPALSNTTTRWWAASASTKAGDQSSMLALNPVTSTSGGPEPTIR